MLTRLSIGSVAGAARGMLGLPSLAEASAAASASGLLSLRHFADQHMPSKPAAAGEADSSAVTTGTAQGDSQEVQDASGTELTPEQLAMYSKRQQAHLGMNPEKYKHFLPRMSRKEQGSYADPEFLEYYEEELELYPKVPDDVPLYSLPDVVPEMRQPECELLDKIMALRAENPDMSIEEIAETMGLTALEAMEAPPRPGAQRILRFEARLVMSVGVDDTHPANKKVKLRVYLRDLQREAELSEEALQYIARICGPRYNPAKGELLLTSDKYGLREDNRRHCMEMLVDLVEEGKKAYPLPSQSSDSAAQEETSP